MKDEFTYWYLGTPYTNFPAGRTAAYIMACRLAALLIRKGIPVYTPIGHTHPIAEIGEFDPVDHDLWVKVDEPMVRCSTGLIVVMAESWEESRGIAHEIRAFELTSKPIVYWDPAIDVPDIVLNYKELLYA